MKTAFEKHYDVALKEVTAFKEEVAARAIEAYNARNAAELNMFVTMFEKAQCRADAAAFRLKQLMLIKTLAALK